MKSPENRAGQIIRHHRIKLGLTQAQIAEKLGISTGYMTMLERGLRTRPSEKVLNDLKSTFKLTDIEFTELRAELLKEELPHKDVNKDFQTHPFLNTFSEFLSLPPDSHEGIKKLNQLLMEMKSLGTADSEKNESIEAARLLTMGYFCSVPEESKKAKKKTSRPSVKEKEISLAKEIRNLIEILIDNKEPIHRRISLAKELVSFAKWKTTEQIGNDQ